jgi:hypothetical protein
MEIIGNFCMADKLDVAEKYETNCKSDWQRILVPIAEGKSELVLAADSCPDPDLMPELIANSK